MPLTTEDDHDCLGGLGPQWEEGLGQLTLGGQSKISDQLAPSPFEVAWVGWAGLDFGDL